MVSYEVGHFSPESTCGNLRSTLCTRSAEFTMQGLEARNACQVLRNPQISPRDAEISIAHIATEKESLLQSLSRVYDAHTSVTTENACLC
mmetsp:Transcript_15817/g.25750  ORF Transcript_15817/g.25750 Transcript_15817/m.25750 type:complete len:90 (-) Transcript_15817:3-272(-)